MKDENENIELIKEDDVEKKSEIEDTNEKDEKDIKRKLIKIIILLLLIIIVVITSFKSGERFFDIKNANFDDSYSSVESSVAYWYFNAEIRLSKWGDNYCGIMIFQEG